jgi:CheY-like chemotaxis protein
VGQADSGEACLSLAQARPPDLIVMDSVMPGLDGLETTRRLHALAPLKTVPVIVVSASASPADAQRSLAAGAHVFLPKPLDLDQLLHEIGRLLNLAWITEATRPPADASAGPAPALVAPPGDEMEILHQLAQIGNMHDIRARAAHIAALGAAYVPFAQRLHELADRFQSRAILELVTQFMDHETHR